MNYFKEGLLNLDYFGQPLRLTFDGRKKFSTELGGILTLIIFTLITVLAINQGSELLNHLKPKVNSVNLYLVDQPIINLSDRVLMFNFQFLTNAFKPNYDPSYFTFKFQHYIVDRLKQNPSNQYFDVDLENCSLHYDSFMKNGNFSAEFQSNFFSESYCMKDQFGIMGGSFASNFFSNYRFKILKCNNATSKVPCRTPEEINKFFDGAYFEFYFIDKYINSENFTHPFQYFLNTYFISLDPNSNKYIDIYFKTVNVTTDKGFLFEDTYTQSEIIYDYVREQISVYRSGTTVVDFHINSSFNFLSMTRNYMKIQDLAATIGGILKILLVAGLIISKFFNEFKMLESILNTLYSFDINDEMILHKNNENTENPEEKKKTIFDRKKNKLIKELEMIGFHNRTFTRKNINTQKSICLKNNENSSALSPISKDYSSIINNNINDKVNLINLNQTQQNLPKGNNPKIHDSSFDELNRKFDHKKDLLSLNNSKIYENADESSKKVKAPSVGEFENYKLNVFKKIDQLKKNREGEFYMNYFDAITLTFCVCCSPKYKKIKALLDKSREEVAKYLNFLDILKMLQEFAKLKMALMNHDQINIFSCTTKPIISSDNMIDTFLNRYELNNQKVALSELFDSYLAINKETDQLNTKLIELFDEDYKNAFDLLLKNKFVQLK